MKVTNLFITVVIIFTIVIGQNNLARLIDKEGNVSIRLAGDLSYSNSPLKNSIIYSGDALKTGENGYAQIEFQDDKSCVSIYNDSELSFHENFSARRINLEKGELKAKINPNLLKSYSLETPGSAMALEDTEFEAKVRGEEQFVVIKGKLEVVDLASGEKRIVKPDISMKLEKPPKPKKTTKESEKLIDKSSNTKNEQVYAHVSPQEQTSTTDDNASSTSTSSGSGDNGRNWNLGLGVGSVTLDGKVYNQISLRPEFRFGKLGVGLDLYFYLDEDGNIREDDWDEFSDYIDKIYYVRWGKQGDPFFARAGALSSVTLGYGILMNGYTNTLEYPHIRNIGVHFGMKHEKLGWEVIMGDIKELSGPGLIAGRVTYDYMWKLRLGGTIVVDFNQYKGLVDTDEDDIPDMFDGFPDKKFSLPSQFNDGSFGIDADKKLKGKKYHIDSDGDGIPDEIDYDIDGDGLTDNHNENPDWNVDPEIKQALNPFNMKDEAKAISAVAFDAAIPVIEQEGLKLDIYGQTAFFISEKVRDYNGRKFNPGWGATIPGFRASFFNWINCNLEYRFSGDNFLFGFWDRMYDMERVSIRKKIDNPGQLWAYTKDELKLYNDPMKGVFGAVDFNLFEYLIFATYYQHMSSGEEEIKSFRSSLSITSGKIPKLAEAMAFYQRNNDKNPFKFSKPSENTILGYRIGLDIGGGAILSYVYNRTYRDLDGNGKINGKREAVTINTIETGFRF